MSDPYFFGYGSLVNIATHDYDDPTPARISGWKRKWRHTKLRDVAYLTAIPQDGSEIDGLIARVPRNDWTALDIREASYTRSAVLPESLSHGAIQPIHVQIYQTRSDHDAPPSTRHPILLSYVDVVVQGYLTQFGEAGVADFFASTDGWDAPILNDRSMPRYSRAQQLTKDETALVDAHLAELSAKIEQL